ncbi:twin-arginine translocase TatA/TatE family subunit [Dehalococcoidia bacterium]|nr:twin-arginine translocase TatA/TatE family subunit [Dehalococcoidia bacterium]
MFRGFGVWEIVLILGVVLLLFGARKLPQVGNSLGKGLREFKNGITGTKSAFDDVSGAEKTTIKDEDTSTVKH